MKLFLLLLLSLPLLSKSQDTKNITIGREEKIHSSILNEDRAYYVYVPESFSNKLYSKQQYPVIYVLDGDSHFKGISGIMESLSAVRTMPEAVIVAIPHKDRVKDLTPTAVKSSTYIDSLSAKTSGGAEDFTAFLQKELIPHIDSTYSAAPYRVLIGHALGGLFVINTLLHHTALFNSYVAIDPALWWDDQKLVKDAGEVVKQEKFKGRTLYLPVAAAFKPGTDTQSTNRTLLIKTTQAVTDLIGILNKYPANGLQWTTKKYTDEGHNSLPLIAEYDALHQIFSTYTSLSLDHENLYNASLNSDEIKIAISSGYHKISRQMGYEILPSEVLINEIAAVYLNADKPDIAYQLLEINQKNYPKSFNVYDAMGDYYYGIDNIPKAIEQYRKAINILYYQQTVEKLKKLQGEREH